MVTVHVHGRRGPRDGGRRPNQRPVPHPIHRPARAAPPSGGQAAGGCGRGEGTDRRTARPILVRSADVGIGDGGGSRCAVSVGGPRDTPALRTPGSGGSSVASSKSLHKRLSRTTITCAWEAMASASTCLSLSPERVSRASSRLSSRRITASSISSAKPLRRYDRTSWNTFSSHRSCLPTRSYVEYATRPCPSSIHARSCTPAELGDLSLRTPNALASRTTGVHTRPATAENREGARSRQEKTGETLGACRSG